MPDVVVEVPPESRELLRPLYADYPGMVGCVDAALEGVLGRVYADSIEAPIVAAIHLDFWLVAGAADAPIAEELVKLPRLNAAIGSAARPAPPTTLIVPGPAWLALLRRVWGDAIQGRERVEFSAGAWDRSRLQGFIDALPAAFALTDVSSANVGAFADLADSLVYNYDSLGDFLARGVGFGVKHEGRFVSGCSSFALSSRMLEFEIDTHPDFERRGFALAAASRMLLHCMEKGLEPCWDAANPPSAQLAEKLGFVNPRPYTAYALA